MDVMYSLDDKPINVCNMYKFLINLFKLDIIPIFKTQINNKLNELVFIFTNATITYYVDKTIWEITIGDFNNKYVFESNNINEILKIALKLFSKNEVYNIHTVNNKKIHNLNQYNYYMFVNNFIKHEQNKYVNKYKKTIKYMPEELWHMINKYYEHSDIYYYDFLDTFL